MVYAQNDSAATRGATTGASIKISAGGGTFQFSDSRGNTDRPLQVFYHRPDGWTINSPIVFIMHGVNREAARYCNDWTYLAKKYNVFPIV